MFIDMFHIQIQLMLRLDWWNEYVCMYIQKTCSFFWQEQMGIGL